MNFYALIQSINSILFFSAGIFVYLKDRKNHIYKSFLFFCLAVSAWTICYVRWLFSPSYNDGLFWIRALHIGSIFIPVTFLHHILKYLGISEKGVNRVLIIMGYILSFFFLSISYTPLFIRTVEKELSFPYWPKPGFFYHFYIIWLFAYPAYCWYLMLKKASISYGQEKKQLKYLVAASAIGYLGGGTNFFLHYNIPIPPFGDFLCPMYPIGVAYLILQHQLFGINVIIRKSLVYSMLVGSMTAIFFASMLIIEKFFQDLFGYQTLVISIAVGFLIALGFNPLKDFLQRFVDRQFFHGSLAEIVVENEHLRQEMLKQDRMKAVSTLAASMAHEIKNPLTVIKTFTDFLPEKYNEKNFIDKFTRLVKPQVEKINFTIQQLLDFSKPSMPDLKPANICQILRETSELLSSDFLKNKIETRLQLSDNGVIALIDPNQMKQVFLNLLLNAIDAMPYGGILKISTQPVSSGNKKFIEVCIQDTGHGISKEDLNRIFQPFFTTKPNGTGLGLSVVHDILGQHKATIKVESEEGAGTKFIIDFAAIGRSTN